MRSPVDHIDRGRQVETTVLHPGSGDHDHIEQRRWGVGADAKRKRKNAAEQRTPARRERISAWYSQWLRRKFAIRYSNPRPACQPQLPAQDAGLRSTSPRSQPPKTDTPMKGHQIRRGIATGGNVPAAGASTHARRPFYACGTGLATATSTFRSMLARWNYNADNFLGKVSWFLERWFRLTEARELPIPVIFPGNSIPLSNNIIGTFHASNGKNNNLVVQFKASHGRKCRNNLGGSKTHEIRRSLAIQSLRWKRPGRSSKCATISAKRQVDVWIAHKRDAAAGFRF